MCYRLRETGLSMRMKGAHFQLILSLYAKIIDCEGGEVIVLQDGAAQMIVVQSEIPENLWCARCKSLSKRAQELKKRWLIG